MSIYVASVELHNWQAYRGTVVVQLRPEIYSVVAETENDEERSNGVGKTALLEAIEFALTGEHRHRIEDGWITAAETEGWVQLTLSDGTVAKRSRKRGKSTQLHVGGATGAEAQKLLDDLMGFDRNDFRQTTWFRQKGMADIILMRAGERTEIFNAWLRLGKLKACEANAGARLKKLSEQEAKLCDASEHVRGDLLACGGDHRQQLEGMSAAAAAVVEMLTERIDELGRELQSGAERARVLAEAEEYDRIVTEGVPLKARAEELKGCLLADDWIERVRESNQAVHVAAQELERLEELNAARFDGTCPVNCKQCPIAGEINAGAGQYEAELARARVELAAAQSVARDLEAERVAGMANKSELDRAEARLQALRERLVAVMPSKQRAGELAEEQGDSELESERDALFLERKAAGSWSARASIELTALAEKETKLEELNRKAEELRPGLETLREAVAVFRAAQRSIAEATMGEIEAEANGLLRAVAVDLTIALSWAREARGLAETCDQCGSPYPSSQRVKSCTSCGAKRGPKQVEELTIELSDRSGALDDLAGIAFRLAARAWLCRERGVRWGVVALDEPLASLDAANRRAVAVHVAAMLRRQCSQAFLVSHDAGATNVLPGRIVVKRLLDGSRTIQVQ